MKERATNAYLSVGAFARRYGLTRHTVYKLLDQRALETWRAFGLIRIKNLPPDAHQPTPARRSPTPISDTPS
jgi:hypothetical protein